MNFIYAIIKNIVVCMFISNVVEMVISSDTYKKYIKLFIGLLLIIIMIPKDFNISSMNIETINNKALENNNIKKEISNKIKDMEKRTYRIMEKDIKEYIQDKKIYNILRVKVRQLENKKNGSGVYIKIIVKNKVNNKDLDYKKIDYKKEIEKEIKTMLLNKYNLLEGQIKIEII